MGIVRFAKNMFLKYISRMKKKCFSWMGRNIGPTVL
jgi:hypothetical protein